MSKETLVETLRKSVQAFQEERGKYPGTLDLSGVDLSNADLQGAQLNNIDLRGVDFTGADLTGANLSTADLRGAKFSEAKLLNVNFHRAAFEGADFRGAIIGGMEKEGRICLNQDVFGKAKWSKAQLEYFLGILNTNQDWEIKYEVLPKVKREQAGIAKTHRRR